MSKDGIYYLHQRKLDSIQVRMDGSILDIYTKGKKLNIHYFNSLAAAEFPCNLQTTFIEKNNL